MITKEDIKKLKQGDRIEILTCLGLIQGNYINNSLGTGALIILTAIMAMLSPFIAFIFLIFCAFKVVKDKKRLNKEIKELSLEYFEIKPRGNK